MEDEDKTKVDTSDADKKEDEVKIEDTEEVTSEKTDNPETDGKSYIKHRVDRAVEKKEEDILKNIGVETLEDAKEQIELGKKALNEVNKLKEQIALQNKTMELKEKTNLLIKALENENVFDAEALANYVDFDKVKLMDGNIQDVDNIIANLKHVKPNFFANYEVVGDTYIKGKTTPKKTALEKQKEGNTVGAIDDYLRTLLK